MKSIFSLFLTALLLLSTQVKAQIVTSKSQAIKKNIYELPQNKVASNTAVKQQSKAEKKQEKQTQEKLAAEVAKKAKKLQISTANETDIITDSSELNYLGEQLVYNAFDNLGSPYRGGGMSKAGFDCSGLVYTTFKNFEITLPRSSNDMSRFGNKIERNSAKAGDLIFFRTNGKRVINHVGLVIEVLGDEVKFVHSSTSSGVIISSTKENYYGKTFAQINRVVAE